MEQHSDVTDKPLRGRPRRYRLKITVGGFDQDVADALRGIQTLTFTENMNQLLREALRGRGLLP